jgi:hypothetical protein
MAELRRMWWHLDAPLYFRQVTIPQAKMRHRQNLQTLDIVIEVVSKTEKKLSLGRPHTPETGSSLYGGPQFGGVES